MPLPMALVVCLSVTKFTEQPSLVIDEVKIALKNKGKSLDNCHLISLLNKPGLQLLIDKQISCF
jgi:hypothetical protein